jgi:integrase
VQQEKAPGRHCDGNGLYLIVDPNGAKRWVLRAVINGHRRDMGLGPYRLVSLKDARELAATYRKIARNGGDPIAERKKAKVVVPTFAEAATTVHVGRAWKNKKHQQQWINTLTEYAFPMLGNRRVDQIETADVLKVLTPIWTSKPETALRVKQRIKTVLDYSKAAGFRSGDNPVEGVTKGLPKQANLKKHHKALPHKQLPEFIAGLRSSNLTQLTKLAFEFLILTAARTSEVLGARWDEVNLEDATWTIPPQRMKAGREHKIPLSKRAVEILRLARSMSDGYDLVFPSKNNSKPLSNMVFEMAVRRMNIDVTPHGFRSTFRDWSAEETNFPREVCEKALAHTIKNKAEAAYFRSDLFSKRRELMEQWSEYATTPPAEVIRLSA